MMEPQSPSRGSLKVSSKKSSKSSKACQPTPGGRVSCLLSAAAVVGPAGSSRQPGRWTVNPYRLAFPSRLAFAHLAFAISLSRFLCAGDIGAGFFCAAGFGCKFCRFAAAMRFFIPALMFAMPWALSRLLGAGGAGAFTVPDFAPSSPSSSRCRDWSFSLRSAAFRNCCGDRLISSIGDPQCVPNPAKVNQPLIACHILHSIPRIESRKSLPSCSAERTPDLSSARPLRHTSKLSLVPRQPRRRSVGLWICSSGAA